MASTTVTRPSTSSTKPALSPAQARARDRGLRRCRRGAARPAPVVRTPPLPERELADPVDLLALMLRGRPKVRADRWRLVSVVWRILVTQQRAERSSTIRIGTHELDEHRLLPRMRADPACTRGTHNEPVRRALAELEACGLLTRTVLHDEDGEDAATEIQLQPSPTLYPEEAAAAIARISHWFSQRPTDWRRPLRAGTGGGRLNARLPRCRGARPQPLTEDPRQPVPGEETVSPVPGGPPCGEPDVRTESGERGDVRYARGESAPFGQTPSSIGPAATVARHREKGPSPRKGLAAQPNTARAPTSQTQGPPAGHVGRQGAAPGPSEPVSRRLSVIGALLRENIRPRGSSRQNGRDAPVGLDDAAIARIRTTLDAGGLLEPQIGPDGLGRLSATWRRRLASDMGAWPALQPWIAPNGSPDPLQALEQLATSIAARGGWYRPWLTTRERDGRAPIVPLIVLVRGFRHLCTMARAARTEHLLETQNNRQIAAAIAARPIWLTGTDTDPLQWIGPYGERTRIACDWIPGVDELADAAPAIRRLLNALGAGDPLLVELWHPTTGDYATVPLHRHRHRPDLDGATFRTPRIWRGRRG
jgi:hypothetical protein